MGTKFLKNAEVGTLWLFDLGFFKVAFLAALAKAKNYFLCRLQSQVQLHCHNAQEQIEKLDLDELLRARRVRRLNWTCWSARHR